jgi:exonuclease III
MNTITNTEFTIIHQNIASFLKKKDELEISLLDLAENNSPVDVICLTEHFVHEEDVSNILLMNYKLSSYYCRREKRGGSCIFTKKHLDCKELTSIKKLSVKSVFECSAIEVAQHKLIVVCIYRTPNINNVDCFMEKLNQLLNKLTNSKNKKIIICGDFNIDVLKDSRLSHDFENTLLSHNLRLEIRQVTRTQSGSCLDNIAHNIYNRSSKVLILNLSDHLAQLLRFPIKRQSDMRHWYIFKRIYNSENLDTFKSLVGKTSFNEVYSCLNVNEAYNKLFDYTDICIECYYHICFPLKKIRISAKQKITWLTNGIRISSKNKRNLYMSSRKSKCEKQLSAYKCYCTIFKKVIDKSQRLQNSKAMYNAVNKTKTAWKIINKNKYMTPKSISKVKYNGKIVTKPTDIANAFNNSYIDQVQKHQFANISLKVNRINKTLQSVYLTPTTPIDIHKITMKLKSTNSTGYDSIPTIVLKHCSFLLARPLSHVINLSLKDGTFPEKLKVSLVKPLFKKGDQLICENYRPVALLPVISKIFERVIHNIIYRFIEKYNILADEQFGFRKGRTTNLAIYDLMKTVTECLNKRIPVMSVFMDMSKAFDFVCHKKLLQKLFAYGIRGPAYALIESYLTNRQQYTEITYINEQRVEKKASSQLQVIKYGVPQGSILGPLLFILYINDLPQVVNEQMVLFADDSTLVIKGNKNRDSYENLTNTSLKHVIEWMNDNNLMINLDKTKCIQFNLRKPPLDNIVKYNEKIVEHVNEIRFLGIQIDSNVRWKQHINNLCKKIYQYVYVLKRLKETVSQQSALIAYHAYVSSNLRYGIIHWGNAAACDLMPLFKAQKKTVRALFKVNQQTSCRPLFKKLGLLTLCSIYIYESCIFVKQYINRFTVKMNTHPRPATNVLKILPPSGSKTSFYKKTIYTMAPKMFNKLPDILKGEKLTLFKVKLSKLLKEKCYYNLNEFFMDTLTV